MVALSSCLVQFSSVAQLCPTLCDPMNRNTPGLPVHHQLPESTQTHVHWVGDAIQPSHPLSSPSPPALNLSQHQGLFKWVSSSASGGQNIESFSFDISPSSEHPGLISSVNGTYFSALTKMKIIKKSGVQFFGINRCDTCMKLLLSCILLLHYNIVHSQARGRIFSQVKYYQVVVCL